MEYAYQKLMKENNLSLNDLNEDAINGIESIKQVERSINMLAKKGKTVSAKIMSKIKSNDKWICSEILEILDGKERNESDEIPFDDDEILDEIREEQENESEITDPTGIKIDTDLDIAYMNGNTRISLEDLKNVSRTAYNVIFDNYEPNVKNGIETTYFNLIETEKYIFTLNKK